MYYLIVIILLISYPSYRCIIRVVEIAKLKYLLWTYGQMVQYKHQVEMKVLNSLETGNMQIQEQLYDYLDTYFPTKLTPKNMEDIVEYVDSRMDLEVAVLEKQLKEL